MSWKISTFKVSNKTILSPMPTYKSKNIFAEIGKFFKENDATSAMNTIMDMTRSLSLSEKRLFGSVSHRNCKLTQVQVLQILLLFPCFMIKNAYNYASSALGCLYCCKKDVFYRFLSNENYDWRKILAKVSTRLWNTIQAERTSESDAPVCLMVDDTDFPKRGMQAELLGMVHSHIKHAMQLGFKSLFLGITDGKSQMLLDFCLVGEKGKNGNYCLKKKELDARFTKEHTEGSPVKQRIEEYDKSKITLMIEMIRRAIHRNIHFDYVLADSWFCCAEIIRFITSRHVKCHYLGMLKMGKTKYEYNGQRYTAKELVRKFNRPKHGRKWSRQLRCYYITVDVKFAGRNVRLFFTRRTSKSDWSGLITTNRSLSFKEAYRTYSMRWSLEVVFKEGKQNLGLGKYQMRNFSSQIACTAITAMQYDLLSIAKRFSDYETIGGIFKDAAGEGMELSVTERIWSALVELVQIIARCFGISDSRVFGVLVNQAEEFNHFVKYYNLKMAS